MNHRAESILGLPTKRGRWNATVHITPEQANAILERQPSQRPVNQRTVDRYAASMRSGAFLLTHQGMACDEDGTLFDGQHRLWACFISGVAIDAVVFFNEPRANFKVTDRVDVRNEAQDAIQLGIYADRVSSNMGTSAARFIWTYDRGKNPVHASIETGWSTEAHEGVLAAHPGLPAMVETMTRRSRQRTRLPGAVMTALFTLFEEADAAHAAIFLQQVLTGQNLTDGAPALTLREWALAPSSQLRGPRTESAYRIARAWNAFVAGQRISRLYGSVSPNGAKARVSGLDRFPRIAGYNPPRAAEAR